MVGGSTDRDGEVSMGDKKRHDFGNALRVKC